MLAFRLLAYLSQGFFFFRDTRVVHVQRIASLNFRYNFIKKKEQLVLRFDHLDLTDATMINQMLVKPNPKP